MQPEWIEEWKSKVGKPLQTDSSKPAAVYLKGITSTTENLRIAFKQLLPPDERFEFVIFVISLQNYKKPAGFRLNNENYTAHIADKEMLLMDGV